MANLLTTNIQGDLTVVNQFTLEGVNVNQKLKEIDKLKLDIISINEKIDKIISVILPNDNEPPVDITVPVTSITLNNNYLILNENEKGYLQATISPDNATNKNIIWSSSSDNIALVDNTGCVTAIKQGNAVITARSEDGNKIDTCNITVNKPYTPPVDGIYSEIICPLPSINIDTGITINIPIKLNSMPGQDQNVYITSENDKISITPQSIIFNPNNWNTYQDIYVTGVSGGDSAVILSSTNVLDKRIPVWVIGDQNVQPTPPETDDNPVTPPIEDDSTVDIDNQVTIKYPANKKGKPSFWGALGDSITAGHNAGGISYSYAIKAAERIGCEVHNHGYTGSCISDGYDLELSGNIGYETAFCNRYKEMANGLDLITVFGGFNDCRNGTPLGNFGSTNSKDFYGALHVLITGLKTKYPNARIVFITPFKIDDEVLFKNKARYKMKDYRNAIVRMCNKFELEVLDLSTQVQFAPLHGVNNGYFLPYDPYHPTQQGHIAIASYLVNEMFDDGSAYLNPPSAVMRLNETKTFTVKNSYNNISNAFASTNCINITSRTNNTITITAINKGMDTLTVMLDNGQYLSSVRIDVI